MSTGRVLVVGASGFIGRAAAAAVARRGHCVVAATRAPARPGTSPHAAEFLRVDLARDVESDWRPRLADIDAVVCVAGALRGDLAALHAEGPAALFAACAAVGVARVVQVSALGAGRHPSSPFLATKAQGDEALLRHAAGLAGWHVLRPSVVIGRGGRSTSTFLTLAAGLRPIRLGPGTWRLQPIHVSDLAEVIADLVDGAPAPAVIEAAGPEVLSTDALTAMLRRWLGLGRSHAVAVPAPVLQSVAAAGSLLPGTALTSETLTLLAGGNVASDVAEVVRVRARPLAEALAAEPASASDLAAARAGWTRPVLVACLALVWLGSGAASLLVSGSRADALLAGLGLVGRPAATVTVAGAFLDLTLGLAILVPRLRRPTLIAQIYLVIAYTALGTVALPWLWLDPFAPFLKNLAVVGVTLSLLAQET